MLPNDLCVIDYTKVQYYHMANFVESGLKSSLRIWIFVKWEGLWMV